VQRSPAIVIFYIGGNTFSQLSTNAAGIVAGGVEQFSFPVVRTIRVSLRG
jgi:hypothetical protein